MNYYHYLRNENFRSLRVKRDGRPTIKKSAKSFNLRQSVILTIGRPGVPSDTARCVPTWSTGTVDLLLGELPIRPYNSSCSFVSFVAKNNKNRAYSRNSRLKTPLQFIVHLWYNDIQIFMIEILCIFLSQIDSGVIHGRV